MELCDRFGETKRYVTASSTYRGHAYMSDGHTGVATDSACRGADNGARVSDRPDRGDAGGGSRGYVCMYGAAGCGSDGVNDCVDRR